MKMVLSNLLIGLEGFWYSGKGSKAKGTCLAIDPALGLALEWYHVVLGCRHLKLV